MHTQNVDRRLPRGHLHLGLVCHLEVSETDSKLLFDDFVPGRQLFFELINVVVSLFDMEFCTVLFALDVYLLQVQQMLVVLHINRFYFLLYLFLLILLEHLCPHLFQLAQLLAEDHSLPRVLFDLFFQFCHLLLYLLYYGLSFIFGYLQLLAE